MSTHHFNVAVNIGDQACAPQRVHNALSSGLRANDPSLPTITVDVMPVDAADADTRDQLQLAMRRIDLLTGDLEVIGNALKDEAVRRDWCEEYEAFVESVNSATKVWDLPSRRRDYRVEHVYEVRIIGSVSAINDGDANVQAAKQYGQIRESYHFLLPHDANVDMDHGALHDVTWHHEQSTTSPEED